MKHVWHVTDTDKCNNRDQRKRMCMPKWNPHNIVNWASSKMPAEYSEAEKFYYIFLDNFDAHMQKNDITVHFIL